MAHAVPLPNIMEALQGIHYPATVDTIVMKAHTNRAARVTLKLLSLLPDRVYRNATEVNHALGEIEDMPDSSMKFWSHNASQELEDEAQAKRDR